MFARTKRLTLRPGWPEDAPALFAAIAHEDVVRMTAHVPWPYTLADAEAWLRREWRHDQPLFLIVAHDGSEPRLVGGIGLHPTDDGHEIGYWLTPAAWGRGYATEAGRAVIDAGRHALGLRRLTATHALDNPASGAVLRKLGFRLVGEVSRYSLARGGEVASALLEYGPEYDFGHRLDHGEALPLHA